MVQTSTEILPDDMVYGFVADRILRAVGDTKGDPDRFPDGVAAEGTVVFKLIKAVDYTENDPATVITDPIECTIHQTDDDPKRVGLLVDPAGHVGNVSLALGYYEVTYRLVTGRVPKFDFWVYPEYTAENPGWLPNIRELTPGPAEKFVVNEQVYTDTLVARNEAESFRDEVVTYHGQTVTLVNRAETAATTATTMAGEAETFRDQAAISAGTAVENTGIIDQMMRSFATHEWEDTEGASTSLKMNRGQIVDRNYIRNPSFETDPGEPYNSTSLSVERSTDHVKSGTYSQRSYAVEDGYKRLGAKWEISAPDGVYEMRAWVYIPSSNVAAAEQVRVQTNSEGQLIKYSPVTALDEWFEVSVTFDLTGAYPTRSLWLGVETEALTAGDSAYIDQASLTSKGVYFDGDTEMTIYG